MGKVHVVYDKDGNVIAFGTVSPSDSVRQSGAGALEGQKSAILELPVEVADLHVKELAGKLKVDVSSTPHRLV